MSKGRSAFTEDEDQLLVKYIAVYCPGTAGRLGNKLYKDLVENVDKKWSWSRYHTWQSWRERYKNKQDWFNHQILKYQNKKNLPSEHRTVMRLTQPTPKTKQKAAAEGETGDEGERRIRKRKGSDVRNEQGKRAKRDPPSSPMEKRAGATANRQAKRPTNPKPPPAEETDTEDEDEPGPPASNDYRGGIYEEPEDDESEVNALLTDGMDEEIDDPHESPRTPHEHHEPVYPDLNDLPSPNLTTREPHLGERDSVPSRPTSPAEVLKPRNFPFHPSQEPTPPVSGADDSTLNIDPHVPAKKSTIRPPARKDPPTTNPTNKSPPKRSRLSRQNNDDDPFGTPPPTPVHSQHAAKPKRPPVLVEGGFRTAFSSSRRAVDGSNSDSSVEFVEPKKTWPPQRNKGVTTSTKSLVKSRRDTSASRKVDKGKGRDKNSAAASLNNGRKTSQFEGTEAVVDHLAEGDVDEDDAMDVDDMQADSAAAVDLGQPVEGRDRSLSVQLVANGQLNSRNGKGRGDIDSAECSSKVAKVDIRASPGQDRSPETTNISPQRRQPVQVNAIATSSKVTLADLPNFSLNSPPQLPYKSASMDVEPHSLKPVRQRLVQSSVSPPQMAQILRANKVMQSDQPLVSREAELGVSSTSSIIPRPRPLALSKTLSAGITSAPVSVTLVEHVEPERKASDEKIPSPKFTSTPLGKTKSKKVDLRRMAARPSLGRHDSSEKRVPLMDLREVALRRHSGLRRSLSSHPSSHSPTPPYASRRQSRRSLSIAESLPPEELEVVLEFGLKGALEKMAAELGFAYEPVRLIFQQVKTFNKTLAVLRRIMEVGNQAGNEMLAELDLEDEEEDDEEGDQANILDGRSLSTRHKHEVKRPSLHVKPLLDDDQISEYSPPTKSRAGQFSRLVKQGREEEALSRERRRSRPLPRNPSPPALPTTPSPPHIPRSKAEAAAPTTDARTLNDEEMDALFGGPLSQSTVEDSWSRIQPEPGVEELRAEYKQLAMTVAAQDAGAFEKFERRVDPDLLRAWTLELIFERTEPPVQF